MLSGYVNLPRKIVDRIEKGEDSFTEHGVFKEMSDLLTLNKPVVAAISFEYGSAIAHLNMTQTPEAIYAIATLYVGTLVSAIITITNKDAVLITFA